VSLHQPSNGERRTNTEGVVSSTKTFVHDFMIDKLERTFWERFLTMFGAPRYLPSFCHGLSRIYAVAYESLYNAPATIEPTVITRQFGASLLNRHVSGDLILRALREPGNCGYRSAMGIICDGRHK
jgi:hypothetical protein